MPTKASGNRTRCHSSSRSSSASVSRCQPDSWPNFDSTYESVTKDWYFDPAITRAIHVDIRFILWVMSEVDHADNVLREITVNYLRH